MLKLDVENFLKDLGMGANQLGYEIYIVGGFVREELYKEIYGKETKLVKDIDLVINTNAIEFTQKFQRFYQDNHPEHKTFEIKETFKDFGTCKISHPDFPEYQIEIASTRREIYPEPAAFPKVELIESFEEDLPRRDFTINALLKSLNKKNFGELVDYVGAIEDIKSGLIRIFHKESFIDDPTRIPRALRFALQYGFQIEDNTLELIKEALAHPDLESWKKKRKARFEIEFKKLEPSLRAIENGEAIHVEAETIKWIATALRASQ